MQWLFYLDDIEIDEPQGIEDIELSIVRDDKMHGISFEATTSPIVFTGAAYAYLKNKKETEGVKAKVIFRALVACNTYDYEEVINGRLNFGQYKENCGDICNVSLPVEEQSCEVVLKARYDQKVDMDKALGVDGITPLPIYNGLDVDTELPAHELKVAAEGYVVDEGDTVDLSIFPPNDTIDFSVRPTYGRELSSNIDETELTPSVFASSSNGLNDSVISPVVLLDEAVDCFNGLFNYTVRFKGSYNINYIGSDINFLAISVAYGEYPASLTYLHQQHLPFTDHAASGTFDYTFTGTLSLPQGKGFYAWFGFIGNGGLIHILNGSVTFDKETYVDFEGVRSCPATTAKLYMVHETLSRAAEAVTNGCIRVKSEYYGRTDSEPFSFPGDGCGGLRTLTSGLKIRKAPEDNFFASVKDLIEGLTAIDNIGMEVQSNVDVVGRGLLIIEDLSYFYRDIEILRHDGIPKGSTDIEETKFYSKINVGYKKWEVKAVNGLDEFNSNRAYNTSIDTIDATLDITSALVAGSYAIETTREQSFADTGAADTEYDNEIFIICMKRDSYPYGNISVELGNIDNPQNIFSPQTIYNFRISPLRNLMRWYKSIAPAFVSLSDSANKLFFSSGTGNLIASGKMTDPTCRMESVEIQENQNIFVAQFTNAADYTPLWKNELLSYDYEMSIGDYKKIKANKYGYISAQCGPSGEFIKHWIKEIKFKPAKGTANLTLRRKYGV